MSHDDDGGTAGRAEVTRRLQEFEGVDPTAARIFLRDAGGALGV